MLSPSTNRLPDLAAHETIVSQSFEKCDTKRLQQTGIISPKDIEIFTNAYETNISEHYTNDTHIELYNQELDTYLQKDETRTKTGYIQDKIAHYLLLHNNTVSDAIGNIIQNYSDRINLAFKLFTRKDDDSLTILEKRLKESKKVKDTDITYLQNLLQSPQKDYYSLLESDPKLQNIDHLVTEYNDSGCSSMDRYHVIYNRHFLHIRNTPEMYTQTMDRILKKMSEEELKQGIDRSTPKDFFSMIITSNKQDNFRAILQQELKNNFETVTKTVRKQ